MAYIISLNNAKGGVGKTTTTINLAAGFVKLGRSVLCVDFDPQGGLTVAAGLDATHLLASMFHVVWERVPITDIVQRSPIGFDVAPTNIDLVSAEFLLLERQSQEERERALVRALAPVREAYDYILIDNQPTLGLFAMNALTAADGIIVPIATEYMALRGFDNLLRLIQILSRKRNAGIRILGVLATMFDKRNNHSKEMLREIAAACRQARIPMFSQVIATSVRFKEAPIAAQSILDYWPDLEGALAYFHLARALDRDLYPTKGVATRG
jgi:chromosome partitioning protein